MATSNITTQIQRLTDAANIIKAKTEEMGIATTDQKLDVQAIAINGIKVKNSSVITPGVEDVKIDAGNFLKGDQTIKAVTLNADASKIVAGNTVSLNSNGGSVSSVNGTLIVNKYITGSDIPNDATTGNDGDIYLVL